MRFGLVQHSPLSGNLATYGEKIRNGIELAVEQLSQEDIKVRVTFEDTPMSGPGVLSAFRKLKEQDKIVGIAGNFSNVAMLALGSELTKSKIIAMHTAAMDDDILASSEWSLSANSRIRDEAVRIAQEMRKGGMNRVAVVSIETNFGQGYRNAFIQEFKRLGGDVVFDESYPLGETDYRSLLLRLKMPVDGVFAATFGHFLGLTVKQLRELGNKAPV